MKVRGDAALSKKKKVSSKFAGVGEAAVASCWSTTVYHLGHFTKTLTTWAALSWHPTSVSLTTEMRRALYMEGPFSVAM